MPVSITNAMVFSILRPRDPESHKGSYGKLLAVCGCPAYRGAAALSILGALRAGAGVVTLAAPEIVIQSIASRILEAPFLILPDDDALFAAAENSSACLAGCGLMADSATARITERLLCTAGGTLILDAGALGSIAEQPEVLCTAKSPLVITPHPGEMARLLHTDVKQVLADPAKTALAAAKQWNAVTVLKGHRTLVASPDGRLFRNTTGNAGLARGGSGDILAGMIAGYASAGLSALDAALCGVYLHGLAADRCAARLSQQGMLPEDILSDLCRVYLENGL